MPGTFFSTTDFNGIVNPRWRGKCSRHCRRMRNLQCYVSVRRPILSGCKLLAVKKCSYFTAPILRLPMDEIQNTTLKGSIPGSIEGGVVLVKGKLNNALSTNGINQAVHFGKHLDKCFHIPDVCGAGSTFSYWLKIKSVPDWGLIMDSGGLYSSGRGHAHAINSRGIISVFVKSSSYNYEIKVSIGAPEKWVFIVQTWSPSSGVKLYVNGCITMPSYAKNSTRTIAVGRTFDFVIGANSVFREWVPRWVALEMDNFLAWDEELTEGEVWRLYAQGGHV